MRAMKDALDGRLPMLSAVRNAVVTGEDDAQDEQAEHGGSPPGSPARSRTT